MTLLLHIHSEFLETVTTVHLSQ